MNISIRDLGNYIIVFVGGRFDADGMVQFENEAAPVINSAKGGIIIELSKTEYMSSAGLRAILMTAKEADRQGRKLCICGATGFVQSVLDNAGFSAIIHCCCDLKEAEDRL